MGNKLIKKCANCRHYIKKHYFCLVHGIEQHETFSCKFHDLKKEININPEIKRQIVQVIELEELVHMNASVNNKLHLALQSLLSILKEPNQAKYKEKLTQIQQNLTKTMEGI